MMKSSIAAGVVAMSLVAGVGAAFAVDAITDTRRTETTAADPTPTPTSKPTPTGFPAPTPSESTAATPAMAGPVEPGEVSPITAGMSLREAMASGYIERDRGREAACVGSDFYRWATPNQQGLDVLTRDGSILSIGVSSARYRTADGLGIGSTLAEVHAVHRSGAIQVVSDYGQPGLLIRSGERWLGLLFGEATPDNLDDQSKVTFMEVSTGDRPGLLRDGC